MDNLNQEEIDALVQKFLNQGLLGSHGSDPMGSRTTGTRKRHRPYDFRRPEKLSKEHLRNLRTQLSIFGRKAANHLARMTRTSVDLPLVEIDQLPYDEVFASHNVAPVTCIFRTGSESSQGILKVNLSQVFSLIDRLMGGSGDCQISPRPLTEFELALVRAEILEKLLSLLAESFRIEPGMFTPELVDTDERLIPRTLSAEAVMVRAIFNLRLGSTSGHVNLYLPLDYLMALLTRLEGSGPARREDDRPEVLPGVLSRLPLEVIVELGQCWMPAREVAALEPGDVVLLDRDQYSLLDVRVGGSVRFLGRPGLSGQNLAISIHARKCRPIAEEES